MSLWNAPTRPADGAPDTAEVRLIASYARQVNFTENWLEPVSSDSVAVGVGGLMNRHARVHARAGTSTGRVGSADTGGFDTLFADAGLNYALGRHAAFGTSYRYHYHDFAPGAMLAPGIPAFTRRHSVQAYISLGTVIFQRAPRRQ